MQKQVHAPQHIVFLNRLIFSVPFFYLGIRLHNLDSYYFEMIKFFEVFFFAIKKNKKLNLKGVSLCVNQLHYSSIIMNPINNRQPRKDQQFTRRCSGLLLLSNLVEMKHPTIEATNQLNSHLSPRHHGNNQCNKRKRRVSLHEVQQLWCRQRIA